MGVWNLPRLPPPLMTCLGRTSTSEYVSRDFSTLSDLELTPGYPYNTHQEQGRTIPHWDWVDRRDCCTMFLCLEIALCLYTRVDRPRDRWRVGQGVSNEDLHRTSLTTRPLPDRYLVPRPTVALESGPDVVEKPIANTHTSLPSSGRGTM